jgi:putative hydrolase of the HAD superfamily
MKATRFNMNDIAFIYFDAAGTLLFPQPSVGEVYAAIGRRFGSRRDAADLSARFRAAFRRQEALDAAAGWRTSDQRELARWRAIVAETIADATDAEVCFETLYRHFAKPDAWVCPAKSAEVLDELSRRGYGLGIASNFDQRLNAIVCGKAELRPIRHVQISSQVGWGKPAPLFFAVVAEGVELPPTRILFVGDDLRNDYDGARAAGFAALLLDAHGRCDRAGVQRIRGLADLLSWCPPRR